MCLTGNIYVVRESSLFINESINNDKDYSESDISVSEENISLSSKKNVVEFWESGKRKNLSLETVKNKFRFIKRESQLYTYKKQINFNNYKRNMKDISTYTFEKLI